MLLKTAVVAILAYLQLGAVNAQGSKGRPQPVKQYRCPQDDNSQYTSPPPNAVTFQLRCNQGTTAKRIDDTRKDSQKECADFCSEHPQCQSADYNWQTQNCARFSEYIPTISMAGVNTWFPLEERKQQDPQPPPQQRTPPECPVINNVIVESVANAASFTSAGLCPGDHEKIFTTDGGNYMKIRCEAHVLVNTPMAQQPLSTLAECLNYCSDTPGCKSASWEGGRPTWACKLYSEGEEAAVACTNKLHDMAFMIDPPTIEAADDMTIMCSTECPDANGQIWDSPSGTRFRMHCCKRHGVKAFAVEQMSSLKECMAGCAKIPACQSVDYQKETGNCYMGKHSGEPTIQVAGWASAHSMGCAGACKEKEGCCGCGDGRASGDFIGRPAVGPSTGGPPMALSPACRCGNQGLQWAEYPNRQGDNSGTGKYDNFNPALYKNQIPHSEGITSTAGGIDALGGQRITVYGSSVQFDGDYFAVDHKGYIFAPTTGTYKFTMSQVDDTVFLWLGSNAQSGWTRANAALIVNLGSDTATVDVTAGQYLPIRIMFAQGQGKASFKLSIEAPDGSILVDSNTQQSPYVVQFSCDRVLAPRFSDWGVET
ncbi:hypothetical protein SCAR479_00463 [Seiridium cardinale]|uniref:PA14 domain-containing protein n=1 Tax=Seiridium cardinale TaxID=138064 RepID=A0ABR2Y9J8_9PEZI